MFRNTFFCFASVVVLGCLGLSAQEAVPLCQVVQSGVRMETKGEFPNGEAGEADWSFEGNRVVRIAVHFMHNTQSRSGMTTNFSPKAIGDTISGYEYCHRIMTTLNNMLRYNQPMNLPIGNSTPVLPSRYRFVLTGVYFHNSEEPDASFSNLVRTHGGEVINIIIYPFDPRSIADINSGNAPAMTGEATMDGTLRYVQIYHAYDRYLFDIEEELKGNPVWCYDSAAWLFAHETGHSLGLHHTILTPGGKLDSDGTYNDYCTDTPTCKESVEACGTENINQWAPRFGECCTNNLMDYAGYMVLTPEQINRIHFGLQGITRGYLNSSYRTLSAKIAKRGACNSFVGRQAVLSDAERITISEGENLFINADETVILGALTIEQGGVLVIQPSALSVP